MTELFEGFDLAMLTGVLCIYGVLVLLFKDFVQPVTILAALVLSIPGAILLRSSTETTGTGAPKDSMETADPRQRILTARIENEILTRETTVPLHVDDLTHPFHGWICTGKIGDTVRSSDALSRPLRLGLGAHLLEEIVAVPADDGMLGDQHEAFAPKLSWLCDGWRYHSNT